MDDKQLRTVLNEELAGFFAQLTRYIDTRLTNHELTQTAHNESVKSNLDSIAKRL